MDSSNMKKKKKDKGKKGNRYRNRNIGAPVVNQL